MAKKSKTLYNDNLAASLEYDDELGVWLVSMSLAVVDPNGTAEPLEVMEIAYEEVEALLKSLG